MKSPGNIFSHSTEKRRLLNREKSGKIKETHMNILKRMKIFKLQPLKDISCVPPSPHGERARLQNSSWIIYCVFPFFAAFLAESERKVFFTIFLSPERKTLESFTLLVCCFKAITGATEGEKKSYVMNHMGASCFHTISSEKFEVKIEFKNRKY